jgi:hypothetical protein
VSELTSWRKPIERVPLPEGVSPRVAARVELCCRRLERAQEELSLQEYFLLLERMARLIPHPFVAPV